MVFWLLSALLILSAIGVITARNPIYSALFLVGNLLLVGVMYALLNAHFLAAVQVIVYAGAIVVLLLFVLMLLNTQVEGKKPLPMGRLVMAAFLGIAFCSAIFPALYVAFSDFPAAVDPVSGTVSEIGKVLYTRYLVPFEAASLLITAGIVGAVMLARQKGVK
jgi:NADH-quinone oxidoreductase subunit J